MTRFEADLTVGKNWRGRRGRGFLHDDQLVVVVKFRLPLLRLNEFRVRSKNSNRACKETYLSFPYFSSSLPNIRSFLPINLILWHSVVNPQLRQRTEEPLNSPPFLFRASPQHWLLPASSFPPHNPQYSFLVGSPSRHHRRFPFLIPEIVGLAKFLEHKSGLILHPETSFSLS